MKGVNKMTKEQFERATQEIKERGISITAWCNENNVKPSSFYTIKWKTKNKELKVSKAITPIKEIDDNPSTITFKINDLTFAFNQLNEELIKIIIKACLNV